MRPDVLAEHLGQTIRGLFAPVALRVAELEAAGSRGAIALETVTASLGDLGARLATLEQREPIPGPPGPVGPPGRDGVDGKDGQDGKGLNYLGVHVSGKTYDVGDLVTAGGSAWYCARTTKGAPGNSQDWQLMVKRGRDAGRGDR
jgi:hypothetical protein